MKKYILSILIAFVSVAAHAQNCSLATFYTEPATFTAEDEVKLFVDVSGCPTLAAESELYLWIFIPDGPGPDGVGGNGDFCNGSNPNMAMVSEGDNLWSFTFTPTLLFATTPSEIGTSIGFIPKTFAACKGNGDQTDNLALTVDPLVFIPSESRVFPKKFTDEDVVTLVFNQGLASSEDLGGLDEVFVYTWVERSGADGSTKEDVVKADWGDVGTTPELQLADNGDGMFSITFIPSRFYPIDEGDEITTINYIFRNAEGTVQTGAFSASPIKADE